MEVFMRPSKSHIGILIAILLIFVWSVIGVNDTYLTWTLEAAPAIAGLIVLLLTYKRFTLPTWLYVVIAIHMAILLLGAHYSYAKVPLGFWMEDWFGFTRNNYDKIGHFMQGVTPALLMVELLTRTIPIKTRGWLGILSVSVSMAISAIYEIIEWLASLSNPTDTEAFLGTQGYIWDTQSDMFMCLLGSLISVVILLCCRKK